MEDIYVAKRSVIELALDQIDGIFARYNTEVRLQEAYVRSADLPESTVVSSLDLASALLTGAPLCLLESRFFEPANGFFCGIASDCWSLAEYSEDVIRRVQQAVARALGEQHILLNAFYIEASRVRAQQDRAYFADNLVLEICDVVIELVPIGLNYAQEAIAMRAKAVARLSADVKAQIAWGKVYDWDTFSHDLISLAENLIALEVLLGNNLGDIPDELDPGQVHLASQVLLTLGMSH